MPDPVPDVDLPPPLVLARRALRDATRSAEPVRQHEEGVVSGVADDVLRIEGLRSARLEELLDVGGVPSWVVALTRSEVHAVALDDPGALAEGARARRTGGEVRLGVGEELLGRVIDPLGRPLDGRPLPRGLRLAPLERAAPALVDRDQVTTPLYTGALAVDALCPIGRGQRELIVGDEGTGKTSLAVDALVRQAGSEVVSVYVAIGRRRVEVSQIVEQLREAGGRWVVVAAPDDASAGLRVLAPFAGCAVAEHFMDRGGHALVVYDDLSAHATAWRELSLLLRRAPGREAFPGDVFSLHARLLERAAQLGSSRGGGSLTALPLARLESGRLSGYIPTNLISIADGQLVLTRELFVAGQRPALDVGLSVSRVGGRAQAEALRGLAGRLKLDYASFLELEVFARLGTRLEASAERRLAWGRRVRELLKGPRGRPLSAFEEIVRLALSADPGLRLLALAEVVPLAERIGDALARSEPDLVERLQAYAAWSPAEADVVTTAVRAAVAEAIAPRATPHDGGPPA